MRVLFCCLASGLVLEKRKEVRGFHHDVIQKPSKMMKEISHSPPSSVTHRHAGVRGVRLEGESTGRKGKLVRPPLKQAAFR